MYCIRFASLRGHRPSFSPVIAGSRHTLPWSQLRLHDSVFLIFSFSFTLSLAGQCTSQHFSLCGIVDFSRYYKKRRNAFCGSAICKRWIVRLYRYNIIFVVFRTAGCLHCRCFIRPEELLPLNFFCTKRRSLRSFFGRQFQVAIF